VTADSVGQGGIDDADCKEFQLNSIGILTFGPCADAKGDKDMPRMQAIDKILKILRMNRK
jgi:hypothetical protein